MRPLRTAGLILAAGRSSRMTGGGKLTRTLRGIPLVRLAAEALVRGGVDRLYVVLGPDACGTGAALDGLGAEVIINYRPGDGMGSSLAAGVAALGEEFTSVMVMPGDMPLLSPSTVERLLAEFAITDKTIAVPLYRGRRGHPVLFDLAAHRQALLSLTGDRGGSRILDHERGCVLEIEMDDPGVLADVDTEEDLENLAGVIWKSES